METAMPLNPATPDRILLTDEQVRRFITDGYLQLDCGLPAEVHATIYDKLQWVLHEEGNPGNNILPAVPALIELLDHPSEWVQINALSRTTPDRHRRAQ